MHFDAKLKDYINGPQGMGMGTRDAAFIPEFAKPLGAQVIGDSRIKVFIDRMTNLKTFVNLDDNHVMTVVMVSQTFESYQFKGKCIRYGPATPEDQQVFETYMEGFDTWVKLLGLPDGIVYNYAHSELITIEMEVEEIFEQTPKIGTGQKI